MRSCSPVPFRLSLTPVAPLRCAVPQWPRVSENVSTARTATHPTGWPTETHTHHMQAVDCAARQVRHGAVARHIRSRTERRALGEDRFASGAVGVHVAVSLLDRMVRWVLLDTLRLSGAKWIARHAWDARSHCSCGSPVIGGGTVGRLYPKPASSSYGTLFKPLQRQRKVLPVLFQPGSCVGDTCLRLTRSLPPHIRAGATYRGSMSRSVRSRTRASPALSRPIQAVLPILVCPSQMRAC